MIISMHIGAHCTNGPQLMRGLLKNKSILAEHGVEVPAPARYRDILPEVMRQVKTEPASSDMQEMLLDQLLDHEDSSRVVLSYENVICRPHLVFENAALYSKANFKLPWLRNVFADHKVEFMIGLRNPATFIPEVFARCGTQTDFAAFMGGVDPLELRWSEFLTRIQEACPDVSLSCFVFEDTPITWAQVVRKISGLSPMVPIAGGLDQLGTLMQPEGMVRLRTFLKSHRPKTERQRDRILSAFWEKYAMDAEMDLDIDLPDWDQHLVDELTRSYERDLEFIEQMQGVKLITQPALQPQEGVS